MNVEAVSTTVFRITDVAGQKRRLRGVIMDEELKWI
jgi:hypothetical protein